MNSMEKFREIAGQDRFKGWPVVGEYTLGDVIPYFGKTLKYTLATGNGNEEYVSLIRHFGWVVVFGLTEANEVITLVQWKPGVNKASWELPPGGIGKVAPGTTMAEIISTTKMVYTKETGYAGDDFEYLGKVMIETGKFRGAGPDDHGLPAHMMLARGLKKVQDARQPNRNEIMETLLVPVNEFKGIIEAKMFEETSAVPCALLSLVKLGKLAWTI